MDDIKKAWVVVGKNPQYHHEQQGGGGINYYKQIKENIINFQLLCANCNFIEGVKKNYRKTIWN